MKQNWREIPNFFNFCNKHNFRVITHTVEYPLHTSIWNLPSDELQDIYNFFNSSILKDNNSSTIYSENLKTFNTLIIQVKNWIDKAIKREATEKENISSYKNTFFESLAKQKGYKNYKEDIDYKKFITSVLDRFPLEYHEKIYKELLTIDMYLIIDEINISSEERIYERLKLMLQK
ncbi:MAG: hypothetical protein M9916_10455 [Crocinitomicaceae bacterium]|nr:hypothetical protein [Crocinitomicaceae bacterium]